VPERIGKKMTDTETQFGSYLNEAAAAVKAGKEFECFSCSPALKSNIQAAIANVPIETSKTTWSVMVGSTEGYILREVNEMRSFVIILALIALVIAVVVIYLVLSNTTKPIINVTDTLRDISEGDLSRYFNLTLEKIKKFVLLIKKQADLEKITQEITGGMNEMTTGADQVKAAINHVNQISSQNREVLRWKGNLLYWRGSPRPPINRRSVEYSPLNIGGYHVLCKVRW
jgi:methyl-accepting chemotaxis protein